MIHAEAPQIPETAAVLSNRPMPRLHFIDGLRGLAMLMVLLYHCWLCGGYWAIYVPLGARAIHLEALFSYGHIGVNLFLVLSGFCLYWPYVNGAARREPTLLEFAKKRCRRILPPYYVALVLFGAPLLLQALYHHSHTDLVWAMHWLLFHIFMLQNFSLDYVVSVDGALWTLALEFQLYILFPVLVEAFRRFNPRAVLLVVLLASCLYRFFVIQGHLSTGAYPHNDTSGFVLDSSVFGRCFEFAIGMFAAIVVSRWHTENKSPLRWPDCLLAVSVILLSFINDKQEYFKVLMEARWGFLAAALLLTSSRPGNLVHRVLSSRFLVSLGIFSYSVYLIHLPLVTYLGKFGIGHFTNTEKVIYAILFVVPLMLLLGYIFHLLFERPFLNSPRTKMPDVSIPAPAVPATRESVRAETNHV